MHKQQQRTKGGRIICRAAVSDQEAAKDLAGNQAGNLLAPNAPVLQQYGSIAPSAANRLREAPGSRGAVVLEKQTIPRLGTRGEENAPLLCSKEQNGRGYHLGGEATAPTEPVQQWHEKKKNKAREEIRVLVKKNRCFQ